MAKTNKEGRKLKKEPKLKLQLAPEQKEVVAMFYEHDVIFVHGDFGSGKTLVASYIALAAYRKKEYNKIVIARPIMENGVGFLPGDLKEKLDPFVAPIIHNFNMLQNVDKTEAMLKDKQIEILPVDFAKGITYVDSVVIVDEYEDLNYEDFRMMLSRLGRDSKIIFCGSKEQIHRSIGKHSCIHKTMKLKDTNMVGYATLKSNHRNESIKLITDFLEKDDQ
jgi:phosphate starvation-inducible protein PhoH and related proteins